MCVETQVIKKRKSLDTLTHTYLHTLIPKDREESTMKGRYRTKFPVARIKKIMRLDDEVGKVAQATPVLISKALECFLAALLTAARAEAQRASSRKITLVHLKRAVETGEQFDFLRDFVAEVADPGAVSVPK